MTSPIVTVAGLTTDEQGQLTELLTQLRAKMRRNRLRAGYYDMKNARRDLGISTPPSMRDLSVVLGWSAKAVDQLNRRCRLEGFVVPGVDVSSLGLDDLWRDNHLDVEAPQAGVSSLIHSTSFLISTQGDVTAGEPAVLITARDAMTGTGMWDGRRRRLRSFLSVMAVDDDGMPTEMVMYLPDLNVSMVKEAGRWKVDRRGHLYGVPVEPLVYQPRLGRPFGSSRISRAVMSLHDSALRTMLRSEVSAEFYSAPQRVLLGADEKAFQGADGAVKSMWQAVMGRIWAVGDAEDVPEGGNARADIKEFTQGTQDPHVAQLRAWAQLFAGETGIPLSSLGISGDANPTSSQAYEAGRADLISEAEGTVDSWSPAWRRTMLRALQIKNGWLSVPDEIKGLAGKWRPPSAPTQAAAADAATKTLQQFPWLAETELGLELYGFDPTFIKRAMAEKRLQAGRAALTARRQANAQPDDQPAGD